MMGPFRPGELTAPQAAKLNELAAAIEGLKRLTVAAPLNIDRAAGVPVISATMPPETHLCEVTANNAATPPVHTVKRKTRSSANAITDLTPLVVYENILDPNGEGFAVGTLVGVTQFADQKGYRWAWPLGPLETLEVVTGVECVGGEIVVTTATITGYFTVEE